MIDFTRELKRERELYACAIKLVFAYKCKKTRVRIKVQ
jgi:hypothetical protein